MQHQVGITWDWAEAGRGAVCALPAAVILLAVDVSLGMVFAIATLPVAMLGGGGRGRLDGAGRCRVWFSVRKPAARLLPALLLPGVALGMNHPAPGGLAVAGLMPVGCAWATLVTCCWPRTHPPAVAPTPPIEGLALRRPAGSRAATRSCSPPRPGSSYVAGQPRSPWPWSRSQPWPRWSRCAPARWYVVPAGTALIILLMSGIAGTQVFEVSFAERLVETAVGAGLALLFGVAVPPGLRWLAGRRAPANPAPQTPP